jgi:GTP pyrophosphokinase/guanosine-3',5'-bis(diphosphate) 3'-pyrophosphohydrolase
VDILQRTADLLPQAARQLWQRAPSATLPNDAAAASFAALTEKLGYLSKADFRLVREAYKFADSAHLGQKRNTGEPYITHPVAVAGLCAEWKLDVQAIMAALMHDTIEDCGITKAELVERFGAPTAELVDGLTKLDKLEFSTREETQAENFRKMLLAMARDVRVILVKLADRLHNMRTLDGMKPASRQRIARETLDIYAPIAHRLGLNTMYRELQDLGFKHRHPWRYAVLEAALNRARGNRRNIVERVQLEAERELAKAKLRAQISGREKTVYSIYRKMRSPGDGLMRRTFQQVTDLFGFRVVTADKLDCYVALGVLHGLYKPVPGRIKDYIAIPKANGYQSLHTTLVNPLGTPVEFQLRSQEMHAVAEKGIAAHWMYKLDSGGKNLPDPQHLGALWLQSLVDIQQDTRDSVEFLEHVKVDLFPDEVYVFTPMSKILALPRGATPVDFAYAIHSDVGDHTVGAKVNGEPVPLRTELRSGDRVEVITAPGARPNPAWLTSVRTGRARSRIRHFLKAMERDESVALGQKMLTQALRAEGLALPSLDDEDRTAATLWQQLIRWGGNRQRDDLFADIGLGRKVAVIVAKRLAQSLREKGARPDAVTLTLGHFAQDEAHAGQGVIFIDGRAGASVTLASCCRPVPGDAIRGYLGRGEGLLVHTAECEIGKRLFSRDSERWIHVEWSDDVAPAFETCVVAEVHNGQGVLAKVASAIASSDADILHLDMGSERAGETVELKLLLSVRDRQHLADVLRALRRAPLVRRVWRDRPGDRPTAPRSFQLGAG